MIDGDGVRNMECGIKEDKGGQLDADSDAYMYMYSLVIVKQSD